MRVVDEPAATRSSASVARLVKLLVREVRGELALLSGANGGTKTPDAGRERSVARSACGSCMLIGIPPEYPIDSRPKSIEVMSGEDIS